MSKAFTKESEADEDEDLPLAALPAGGKNYITPAGYAALRRELAEQAKHAAAQADADAAQNARLIALEKLLTDKASGLQTVTLKAAK